MSSALSAILKRFFPPAIVERMRGARRLFRRTNYRLRRALGRTSSVTKVDLVDGFRYLGIRHGDVVMIHSSLRKMGHVDGGASTVVDALMTAIGPEGTLIVPTLSFSGDMYTHFRTYDNDRPFDVLETPSRMGRITEIVRTMPGALRSVHPSHSVAAVGPQAEYLTKGHHRDKYGFGKLSPYYRLCELGGKIIMLGVDLTTMTAFHVIEDIIDDFPLPVHMPDPAVVEVIMPDGKRQTVTCIVHNPEMTAIRDCNKVEPYFVEYSILKDTKIGAGRVMVIDAGRLLSTMQALLDRGITIYTPRH